MSIAVPLGYALAFVYFVIGYLSRDRQGDFGFVKHDTDSDSDGRHARLSIFALGTLVILLGYGTLSDINFSIQECANMREVDVDLDEIYQYLFHGNIAYHQRLYHLLVALVVYIFRIADPAHLLVAARFLSALSAIGTCYFFWRLLSFTPVEINRRLICCAFMACPLNFFYFVQAEPYSLLLLLGVANTYAFFSLGSNRKRHFWGFVITAILGYFTHLFFFVLIAAQMSFALILHLTGKRIYTPYYRACLLIIPVLFLLHRPLGGMLSSPLLEYTDGYPAASLGLFFRQFLVLWGLTEVLFAGGFLLMALLFAFLFARVSRRAWTSRGSPAVLFLSILLVLETLLFLFSSSITAYHGYTVYIARHYILISIPITVLYFAGSGRLSGSTGPGRGRRLSSVLTALLALVFFLTDVKVAAGGYRFDGRGAVRSLSQVYREQGAGHLFLMPWLLHCALSPWADAYRLPWAGGDDARERFYKTDLSDFRMRGGWPGGLKADNFESADSAGELLSSIERDIPGVSIEGGKPAMEKINAILRAPATGRVLLEMARANNRPIPIEVTRLFEIQKTTASNLQEVVVITNRLLLEMTYPGRLRGNKLAPLFLQKERLREVVEEKAPGEIFVFIVIREQILGLQYVDPEVQYRALRTLRGMPGVAYVSRKDFRNLELHLFRRR